MSEFTKRESNWPIFEPNESIPLFILNWTDYSQLSHLLRYTCLIRDLKIKQIISMADTYCS